MRTRACKVTLHVIKMVKWSKRCSMYLILGVTSFTDWNVMPPPTKNNTNPQFTLFITERHIQPRALHVTEPTRKFEGQVRQCWIEPRPSLRLWASVSSRSQAWGRPVLGLGLIYQVFEQITKRRHPHAIHSIPFTLAQGIFKCAQALFLAVIK